jgi:Secretory lipase
MTMTRSSLRALLLVLVTGMAAGALCLAGSADGRPSAGRGSLISVHQVARLSRASVAAELAGARIGPGDPALGAEAVRSGIVAYRVVYRTVSLNGGLTRASGLIVFPDVPRSMLPLVEYGHGTTATRADVPSAFGRGGDGIEGRWTSELFASAGFAAALPDYLGMGVSRVRPQYEVAQTEASASLDLLRAAETVAARTGRRLDDRVLVTGFSQGGAAALALGRAIAHGRGLHLGALAPISGPYELLRAEVPGMFTGGVSAAMSSYLLGYALTAWNPIYHLFDRPSVAFQAPYAARIDGLFDGSHPDLQIATQLPADFHRLITPQYLRVLAHPTGRLRRALIANSTCSGWTPPVPVRLYAARGDTTVTDVNAEICAARIRSAPGDVRLVQLGDVDHDVSDFLALPRVVRWFQALTGVDRS